MLNQTSIIRRQCLLTSALFVLFTAGAACAQEQSWFERESTWNGYRQLHFHVADQTAYVIQPKNAAAGSPWIWRARFPNYHAEMDVRLLARGYHIGYVDVAGMFGNPDSVKIGDAFFEFLTTERGLAKHVALEGVSRGGLFVYNWAAKNPDKVACIYCDTPVLDIKSWPAGKAIGLGTGIGSEPTWQQCLKAYGLSDEQAIEFRQNPIDHAKIIAQAKIPLLHIVSENDQVVPPNENTYVLQERLKKHDYDLQIISVAKGTTKSNGHHFEHRDVDRVVGFITANTQLAIRTDLLRHAKRIVFLGDSITYAGDYVSLFESWLTSKEFPTAKVINVGLPSETVSGLSEKGHAGGRFPRPVLNERLDRVLKQSKPDLVFACYGINCGIYQPFEAKRFSRYQAGIESLHQKVTAAGAELVLITPPMFDDHQANKSFTYDQVMSEYSNWLVKKRDEGWFVIDLHSSMVSDVTQRRKSNPDFTYQPDAVHPNGAGHWFIATQLIHWFGDRRIKEFESPETYFADSNMNEEGRKIIRKRMMILRDAYLTQTGHKRPGLKAGLPVKQAEELVDQMNEALKKQNDNSK